MYFANNITGSAEPCSALESLEAELRDLTSNLDSRFVRAGQTLGEAYDIVERLIGGLDGVIHALDEDAANAAIARMQATASHLMRIPERQAARADAFDTIRAMNGAIGQQMWKINRLLSFLRICGLNIKIAAAGAQDFADFAEIIFARIDLGEREISEIGRTSERLHAGIAGVEDVEHRLAAESRRVVPAVPQKLNADADALALHQQNSSARATRSAEVARALRAPVAAAIGAIQIGDITRQRLEHVTDGIRAARAFLAEHPDIDTGAATAIHDHVLAMLAAQAEDTIRDMARDSRVLTESMQAISPGVAALLELAGTADASPEGVALFETVERNIRQVTTLTSQLHEADARSSRLGNDASATANDLARRARHIHRITNDVQQMAWNTDLRCHRMGDEGRALASVAGEIRGLANQLETISSDISSLFDRLADAAAAIRAPWEDVPDAAGALTGSLDFIRTGSDRLQASLAALRRDIETVALVLDGIERAVDCEQLVADLSRIATGIGAFGAATDPAREDIAPLLDELLRGIAATYTMTREREVHRLFAAAEDATDPAGTVEAMAEDDFDDGLF
ncbi:hypothetical protein [uncultured Sphingomonas sp.]|uniref:hypothetical protein n=1 Tax=uncultured Sphingomonas sp. TaxID=158754 RepID=UPI002625738D|nr:hypothetical protein [uncultured Sphingomonas sp.]